jgi:hypothetical protein
MRRTGRIIGAVFQWAIDLLVAVVVVLLAPLFAGLLLISRAERQSWLRRHTFSILAALPEAEAERLSRRGSYLGGR